jgi:hypothetical protein
VHKAAFAAFFATERVRGPLKSHIAYANRDFSSCDFLGIS